MFDSKQQVESESLDEVLYKLETDEDLLSQVDEYVESRKREFPILESALSLPQSADVHAEGPEVEDHVRATLRVLFAVESGSLKLSNIHEVRRMRGFEEEWQDLEFAMRENFATLRFAILGAQLGKLSTIEFSSETDLTNLDAYRESFNKWEKDHPTDTRVDLGVGFFLATRTSVGYPYASKHLFDLEVSATLDKLMESEKLSDHSDLYARELVFLAPEAISIFKSRDDASSYERIKHLVLSHGVDEEPFIRILQALLFVTEVAGTKHLSPHGTWHDFTLLENFLHAENSSAPDRRELARARREEELEKTWQKAFHEEKLDGKALMELLGMKSGPELGVLLKEVQRVARGEDGELPKLDEKSTRELYSRIEAVRDRIGDV